MKLNSLLLAGGALLSVVSLSGTASAQAVPGLTQTVWNNIPFYDYYPTATTVDEEEAYTSGAMPDSVGIFVADPQAFGYLPSQGLQATRFTGSLNILNPGSYSFYLRGDDAARLRIDGNIVAESTFYSSGLNVPDDVTLNLSAGAHNYDLFYFQTVGGSYLLSGFNNIEAGATFTSQQPAVGGGVPEPATWAMMVMGFGMVGFGLRSRRKQSVTVTYA